MNDWKPLIYKTKEFPNYEYDGQGRVRNKNTFKILLPLNGSVIVVENKKQYRINQRKLIGKEIQRRERKDKGRARNRLELNEQTINAIKILIREELNAILRITSGTQK